MCASRFVRSSREVGRNAGGEAAQNRARRFSVKRACRKIAAFGFPPSAGVAPLSIERDTTAHGQPATPAHNSAPRVAAPSGSPDGEGDIRAAYASLRLFSRQVGLNWDATRTTEAGARIVPRVGGKFRDTTTDDDRTRGGA